MLSEKLLKNMEGLGIDIDLSLKILEDYNSGRIGHDPRLIAKDIPEIDGKGIIAIQDDLEYQVDARAARDRLSRLGLADMLKGSGTLRLDRRALEKIGCAVLPFTAFGILTGGGSTTYADYKRNAGLDAGLFSSFKEEFEKGAALARGKPKGILPAFLNPDGSPGPSYLRLKQRALLLLVKEWERAEEERLGKKVRGRDAPGGGFPLRPFQMASISNVDQITASLSHAIDDPLTATLIRETGCDVSRFKTRLQPMIAAYSHSAEGPRKTFFSRAQGEPDKPLALPGGHGQNFLVLSEIYRELRREGKRYAYLSNVDNIGALPSLRELGIMALSSCRAGFDFSYRTAMDVKGGILIHDAAGRVTCGDIGGAISFDDVIALEEGKKRALFNCATGLFDLDWLCDNIDFISSNIPTRFSDQDKDSGRYSQAEQNTWEVIGLLDDFLVFAVDKSERFLAAKMLMETILMSLAHEDLSASGKASPAWETAISLRKGLEALLIHRYGLQASAKGWIPA